MVTADQRTGLRQTPRGMLPARLASVLAQNHTRVLDLFRAADANADGEISHSELSRLLRKLERKGLAIIDGSKPRPGDMGGTPAHVWWSFEREQAPRFASEAARFAHTHVLSEAQHEKSAKTSPKQIIPCHPVESKVTYEGKVWTVREINLATGMHTIYRSPGITKSDLRMMDMEPFIDEDEEL